MIARAPHLGTYYQRDNLAVWNAIREVTHGGPAWSWVSAFARDFNGRAAYISFKTHYLGQTFQARLRMAADATVDTVYYDGKSRNFTFEQYSTKLKGAFSDIEATGEIVSETRKVRVLLLGLLDPRLKAAKQTVMATPALHDTFDHAVNFLSQAVDTEKSLAGAQRGGRNISDVNTAGGRGNRGAGGRFSGRGGRGGRGGRDGRGGGGRGGRGGRGGGRGTYYSNNRGGRGSNNITDRYYSPEEWEALSGEDKQAVRDKRSERDRRRGVEVVNTRNNRQRTDNNDNNNNDAGNQNNNGGGSSNNNNGTAIGAVMSRRVGFNNGGGN
jgi:hypothetical protein